MRERICKILFLLLLVWPQAIGADHCTVSKIAIIAGSWENTLTKTSYTLQTQDSGSASCHVTQTLRFSLQSSGPGTFTGQTGNALQLYISSNSANRNFYYDGHGAGSYTLTAKAGYGAVDSWTELFTNTYNSTASSTEEEAPANTAPVSSSSSDGGASSAHYGSNALSNKKLDSSVSLSAGRDRLGSIGSPLEFKVETNLAYTRNTIFKWNFGDGSEGAGNLVVHTYEYPGDYVLVLKADMPGDQAVARANVKIIDPSIVITLANTERVELKNNSKSEVSLYGRVLMVGGKIFAFPQDTIIKAGQTLFFSSKITGLKPAGGTEASILVIGNTEQSKIVAKVEEERSNEIARLNNELENGLAVLEAQLAAAHTQAYSGLTAVAKNLEVKLPSDEPVKSEEIEVIKANESQTTVAVKSGWFATIKRFFLRTK
ncbi:MAG: PKD domain-containing protein [bacterium]|nr:PKD domain-containing protein [bacterium]